MTDRCDKCGSVVFLVPRAGGQPDLAIHRVMLGTYDLRDGTWLRIGSSFVDHADLCPARPGAYDVNHLREGSRGNPALRQSARRRET